MKWERQDVGNCLFCTQATQEEITVAVQNTKAFLSGCKTKYPFVRRGLEDGLTDFGRSLSAGSTASPILSFNMIRLLLRWCITDGRQLQDFRRDNARALWRVLFRGPIPDFYRYHPSTCSYIEDRHGRESWIRTQVIDGEQNLVEGTKASWNVDGVPEVGSRI